jgi:hypothetical protein
MCLPSHPCGQQTIVLFFDHRVALAAASLQASAVEYGNVLARVLDETGFLQFECTLRQPLSGVAPNMLAISS